MGDYYTNAVRHPEDTGVGHIRRQISLADFAANGNVLPIGALEAGAIPLYCHVTVITAFNAGTTNTLDVGVTGTAAGFAAAAATLAGATGFKGNLTGTLTGIPLAADSIVYATFGQTGTAATTGKVHVILTFVNKREVVGQTWPQN
jgi:hypothetical protein